MRTEKNISLELANQIAAATVAACSASGYNVSAAVVDRAGVLRALQRADNAGPHTVQASERKAFTSVSAKTPTKTILENAYHLPVLWWSRRIVHWAKVKNWIAQPSHFTNQKLQDV